MSVSVMRADKSGTAFIPLSLARAVDAAPQDPDWLHEHKLDGYRIEAVLRGGTVRLFTRNAHDWSAKFARVVSDLAALPVTSATLDGEVVAVNSDGSASFQRLQQRIDAASVVGVRYHVFDLLTVDGMDLRSEPLRIRREALRAVLRYRTRSSVIRATPSFARTAGDPLEQARERGLEGVISKRLDAPYVSGRNGGWLKVKAGRRQEMVVIGYTDPNGTREGFGALLLGVYTGDGVLRYAGKVGTGFDRATVMHLRGQLDALHTQDRPIPKRDGLPVSSTHWVKPVLVAEVAFAEWTDDELLRQPVFKGLRVDKDATRIRRET